MKENLKPNERDVRRDDIKSLLKIKKPSDIKSLEVLEGWIDDNLQCAKVSINGIEIEFSYYDNLGFLEYWNDSKKAFKTLLEEIDNIADRELEMLREEEEEEVEEDAKHIDTIDKFQEFKTNRKGTIAEFYKEIFAKIKKGEVSEEIFLWLVAP